MFKYGVISGPYIPVILSEYRKIRIRNNSVFGHFSRSDIWSENESIRSNHGCVKSGFSTDNYSSISQKNHLKWHVFENNVGSVFCYVFEMSLTYGFDAIFLKSWSTVMFYMETVLHQSYFLNYLSKLWNWHHSYLSQYQFYKVLALRNL